VVEAYQRRLNVQCARPASTKVAMGMDGA
jgi:hypothetical protein